MVRLTIDGKEVKAAKNSTILEAAQSVGIRIPTLCFHEKMNPIHSCRMCVVEVEGYDKPITACDTRVMDGIHVTTHSERLFKMRQDTLKLLCANHPLDCPICQKAGECMLQDLVYEFGITQVDHRLPATKQPIAPYATPMIQYWHSRCILCLRCVSACRELTGAHAIDIKTGENGPIISVNPDRCVSCGQCAQVCPVGALIENKHSMRWRPWDIKKVRTTCPYCGVGCQQLLHVNVKTNRIVSVTGVEDGAPNQGRLCVKGRFGYDFIYSEERLKTPMIRENGELREASWDEALDLVANKFKQIIAESGPDALAGVSCARSINEDSYNMQKLFRAAFKTNNIDHCART
jgi:predicted molibdopterin-dependent oxidoreductase YjgC